MSLIEKINGIFSQAGLENIEVQEKQPEVIEQKFVEASLADGTIVQIEPEIAEGAAVLAADPNAESGFSPIPDGSYELSDGNIILVSGGMISEVQAPAVEEEEEQEMAQEALTPEAVKKIIESTTTVFSEQIKELQEENAKLKAEFAALQDQATKHNEAFMAAVKEIAQEPAQEPVKKVHSPFKKVSTNTVLNHIINKKNK